MSCNPKTVSKTDGRRFLQEAFAKQQNLLAAQLALAEYSVTHPTKRGDVAERHFINILRKYLPDRYSVDSGIVLDSNGQTSDQIDIVIYDRQYTPTLLDQYDHKYVPAEAVYGVLEVKPIFNSEYLTYASKKAASVRRLHRTSIPIHWAGKDPIAPKPPIDPIAGLITAKMEWSGGFDQTFKNCLAQLNGDTRIDCGLAVEGHSFDIYNGPDKMTFGPKDNALVFFLFRLLKRLQTFATVPAADWSAYAAQLAHEIED